MDCYCLVFWIVTVWPLLRCLTISGVIELQFKRDQNQRKAKTRGYKFARKEVPNYASKTVKIGHHLDCYCLVFWTLTLWPLLRCFTISKVIELRFKRDQSRWKLRHVATTIMPNEEPGSASKTVKIAHHLYCYCLVFWTVTVWPLLIYLTISRVIELRFKWDQSHWKAKTWGYKFFMEWRTRFCI